MRRTVNQKLRRVDDILARIDRRLGFLQGQVFHRASAQEMYAELPVTDFVDGGIRQGGSALSIAFGSSLWTRTVTAKANKDWWDEHHNALTGQFAVKFYDDDAPIPSVVELRKAVDKETQVELRLTVFDPADIAALANATLTVDVPAPSGTGSGGANDPLDVEDVDKWGNFKVPPSPADSPLELSLFLQPTGSVSQDAQGGALTHDRYRMKGVLISPMSLPDSIQSGTRMTGTVSGREGTFVLTKRLPDIWGVQDTVGELIEGEFTVRTTFGQG